MKPTKTKARGIAAFNDYFESYYKDRWPNLLAALKSDPARCALVNPFASLSLQDKEKLQDSTLARCESPWVTDNKLLSHYVMDEASILAARTLPLKPGDRVLDMCAAPGGKALGLIFRDDDTLRFVLNDRSATRRGRLKKVIEDYVASERQHQIKITGHDATKWGLYEQDAYEAILLDAPCSSERHLLEKPSLIDDWSPHRTRVLAIQQFAMLAAAGTAVKPGGHILYATCSISVAENDDVIAKLLKKRDQFEVSQLKFDMGESTQYGWIFLPDTTAIGPLFISLFRRKA